MRELDQHGIRISGRNTTFSIDIANAGMRGVQVNGVRFHGWEQTTPVKTADILLPDTETVVTVERTTPKNAALTVPNDEHLYDGLFTGRHFDAVA